MSDDIQKVREAQERVNELQRAIALAEGGIQSLEKQLEEEFGVTFEEAEDELKKLQAKEKKAHSAFKKALASFEEEWGDVLD